MTIWNFNTLLTKRLTTWSRFSIAAGVLMLPASAFWRGFGAQAIGWGVVDWAIAWFGGRGAQRQLEQHGDSPELRARQTRTLRRLLWLNAGLDILYMLGGWWWSRRRSDNDFQRGSGIGVIVQGAFLFVFDVVHALRVPPVNATER